MSQHQRSILINQSFDDFDHLAETAHYWDLDFHQLDRGPFNGHVFQGVLGRLQIGEARLERILQQRGESPKGLRTFVVPASEKIGLSWRGRDVRHDHLMIFPVNGELFSVSQPDFHVFTISITNEQLENAASDIGLAGLSKLLKRENVSSPNLVRELRRQLGTAIRLWHLLDESDVQWMENTIVQTILGALTDGVPQEASKRQRTYSRIIRRIERFLNQCGQESPSVGELCEQVEVSERTLRNVFSSCFGVSPISYLKARRLNCVRRDLKRAVSSRPKIEVSEIAMNWGFWHMGQFAKDYRQQFGELPSHTLNAVLDERQ